MPIRVIGHLHQQRLADAISIYPDFLIFDAFLNSTIPGLDGYPGKGAHLSGQGLERREHTVNIFCNENQRDLQQ